MFNPISFKAFNECESRMNQNEGIVLSFSKFEAKGMQF